jgi:hypothetical protein
MLEGARRAAFALTIEGGGAAGPLLTDQWRRKGLHLLAMPGDRSEERIRASDLFLDWLADQVTLQSQDLFLARDVPADGPLAPLRSRLIEDVGREVEKGCDNTCTAEEAQHLAEVLGFLTDHGWRPAARAGLSLWQMWARLAESLADDAQKRRLLVTALRHTERADDADRIRQRLSELKEG